MSANKVSVVINPINGNGFINAGNAVRGIAITGRATDITGANLYGQIIKVVLNHKTYTGAIRSDGNWYIGVGPADLAALSDGKAYTVAASVTGAAGTLPSAVAKVTVDKTAALTINPIDGNDFINGANAAGITIAGASTGGIGSAAFAGRTVAVTLNGKTYTGHIAGNGTWSVKVGTADLAALGDGKAYTVAASATDKAGNAASTAQSVAVDKGATVSINPVGGTRRHQCRRGRQWDHDFRADDRQHREQSRWAGRRGSGQWQDLQRHDWQRRLLVGECWRNRSHFACRRQDRRGDGECHR